MERIEKLKSFIANDPKDLFSRHALAMELIKTGQLDMAIAAMEEIIQMDKQYIGTYYHLGKAYEKVELFEKALSTYEQGIALAKLLQKQHELRELMGALNMLKDELM